MLIVCPVCKSRFSFDEHKVGADGIRLRCGKCNAIFRVIRKGPQQAGAFRSAVAPPAPSPRIRVVVANESAAFCQTVSDLLLRESFDVSAYNDGREAFNAILEQKPHVVLLDVALPSMYGFEVCDAIRKTPAISSVKVILIASIYDKTRYKRAPLSLYGADDYIEKHHIPDSLAAMVYRLVSGQKPAEPTAGVMAEVEEEAQSAPQELSPGEINDQEIARQELKREEEMETALPSHPSEPELPEAHVKARRFARIIVSDIVLYNQARVEEGVRSGAFYQIMADDIGEGRALYLSRVPEEITSGTSYLEEAFADLIASKKQELGL
jgi:predicted Zn finger-like uncharacterized protein